ncbi:hypothetical protein ANN_24624 [Periplaneta americana]|uniref:Uncharacterized protein n=1 Tax=Periplaneta americana TaxID=6978 RepID=A0ABQ8S4A3_PERAM|nr:hypothetical protein ANN_24624 [Periplaneta americana]
MHFWLRPYVLHALPISKRLDLMFLIMSGEEYNAIEIKKWQVRGDQRKKVAYEEREEEIINKFSTEKGLLVDVVKPGSGTTNDGNTSRRFFENSKKSSEITCVDEALIHRFSVILDVMSSGYSLNIGAFKKYALDTADLYVKLYGWSYMPATVHKILTHGADVMNNRILPVGQLSDDAQEARHKEYRFFREHNTRKTSRINCNKDLSHMLLISSDPLISSKRKLPRKKRISLGSEVLGLLETPRLDSIAHGSTDGSSEEDSD